PAQALPRVAIEAAVRAGVQRLLHPEDGLRRLLGRFEQGAHRRLPVQCGGIPGESGWLSRARQLPRFRQTGRTDRAVRIEAAGAQDGVWQLATRCWPLAVYLASAACSFFKGMFRPQSRMATFLPT